MAGSIRRRSLRATWIFVAAVTATVTAAGSAALAGSLSSSQQSGNSCTTRATSARVGHIGGIINAASTRAGCSVTNAARTSGTVGTAGDTANGDPPLVWHGGPVMGTKLTGDLVVTPIFWDPAGHPMDAAYKSIITQYWNDVAKASGRTSNVFSILTEYFGVDGTVRYRFKMGTPIDDTNPLPADGCTIASTDVTNIYADGTGYNACLDDDQVNAEADNVRSANGLPTDFSHIYVMYLAKHVETCFFPGDTTTADNACTINFQPSARFCAYHSQAPTGTVYANLPYPIYNSATHFTCGTNFRGGFPVIETPNGNPDADVEISPSSHEVSEAATDPDVSTGWFDNIGDENADECAFIFGPTQGTPGALFNQTINGHHYITQEGFSNNSFFRSGGGCLQSQNEERALH